MKKLVLGGLVIAATVIASGAGLAAAAEPAPAPPTVPIPLLQPIDASQGLLGIQRGTVPPLSTPDLSQLSGGALPGGAQLDTLPTAGPTGS